MIKVYGEHADKDDDIKSEQYEMASFFNMMRLSYPESFGRIGVHVRNEGKRTHGQISRARYEGGFVKGASDIIIPGNPSFICELKSRSKKAKVSTEQIEYLAAAQKLGAFVCVALGAKAAWVAFEEYRGKYYNEI